MSDTRDAGITIARKPGGFLGVTSQAWMRWDAIIRVEVDGARVHVSGGTWVKTRICGTHVEAMAWADALFAAIERERALALGLPLRLSPKSAAELWQEWEKEKFETAPLRAGAPWPGERFDTTSMKVPTDDR